METANILDGILNDVNAKFEQVENVRKQLFSVTDWETPKPQPNEIGFKGNFEQVQDTRVIKVYTNDGKFLGHAGNQYQSLQPTDILDKLIEQVVKCEVDLNLNTLSFHRWNSGKIIEFRIELPNVGFKLPNDKDTGIKRRLNFRTGFGGTLKTQLGIFDWVQVCKNGMHGWKQDKAIDLKHTFNCNLKALNFCDEIFKTITDAEKVTEAYKEMSKITVSDSEVEKFTNQVFGVKNRIEIATRQKNIFAQVDQAMNEEFAYNGRNVWAMLNGITRYTNHMASNAGEEYISANTGFKLNNNAQALVYEYVN